MLCLFSYYPNNYNRLLSDKLGISMLSLNKYEAESIKNLLDDILGVNNIETNNFIKFTSNSGDNNKLKKYLTYLLSVTGLLKIDILLVIDTENYNRYSIKSIYDNMLISKNNIQLLQSGYLGFKNIQSQIEKIALLLDLNYFNLNLNKIEFIGDILTMFYSSDNKIMKFVNLVSIIEYLLVVGNDNITQQFTFKTMIVYEKATGKYLELELLKGIYNTRSAIVHGRENNSILEDDDFQINYITLLDIVGELLNFYIKNPTYINYIKDMLGKKQ